MGPRASLCVTAGHVTVNTDELVVSASRCDVFLRLHVTVCIHVQAATKEFEAELEEVLESENPMVTCAMDMLRVMAEVEPLL